MDREPLTDAEVEAGLSLCHELDAAGSFSRSRTYTAECYEMMDRGKKARCRRRGKCVVAVFDAAERRATEVDRG